MNKQVRFLTTMMAVVLISLSGLTGCGDTKKKQPGFHDIPNYPNSVKKDSMSQSMMGMVKGKLEQFTTEDSFDDVFVFYKKNLRKLNPQVQTHKTHLGQVGSFLIEQKNGAITVAIQEFKEEGKVMITVMRLGK